MTCDISEAGSVAGMEIPRQSATNNPWSRKEVQAGRIDFSGQEQSAGRQLATQHASTQIETTGYGCDLLKVKVLIGFRREFVPLPGIGMRAVGKLTARIPEKYVGIRDERASAPLTGRG